MRYKKFTFQMTKNVRGVFNLRRACEIIFNVNLRYAQFEHSDWAVNFFSQSEGLKSA